MLKCKQCSFCTSSSTTLDCHWITSHDSENGWSYQESNSGTPQPPPTPEFKCAFCPYTSQCLIDRDMHIICTHDTENGWSNVPNLPSTTAGADHHLDPPPILTCIQCPYTTSCTIEMDMHLLCTHENENEWSNEIQVPSTSRGIKRNSLNDSGPPKKHTARIAHAPLCFSQNCESENCNVECSSPIQGESENIHELNPKDKFCPLCDTHFKDVISQEMHFFENHPEFFTVKQYGEGDGEVSSPIRIHREFGRQNSAVVCYKADIPEDDHSDRFDEFITRLRSNAVRIMNTEYKKRKSYKIFFQTRAMFAVEQGNGDVLYQVFPLTSYAHIIMDPSMIQTVWNMMIKQINAGIDGFESVKSGWTLHRIMSFQFVISTYKPFGGASYIKLPFPLLNMNSLLNIDNSTMTLDGSHKKCFKYCVLASKHLAGLTGTNRYLRDKKPETYEAAATAYFDRTEQKLINDANINYPMSISQMSKFEHSNPGLSFTIIGYDDDHPEATARIEKLDSEGKGNDVWRARERRKIIRRSTTLLYNSKEKKPKHIDLLLLTRNDKSHFILIRSLSGFLYRRGGQTKHVCRNCLSIFSCPRTLEDHESYCLKLELQQTFFPHQQYLTFDSWQKTQDVPFVFFCDFEAVLPNCPDAEIFTRLGHDMPFNDKPTVQLNTHLACGFSWTCLDYHGKVRAWSVYRATQDGEDIAMRLIKEIDQQCEELRWELNEHRMNSSAKNMTIIDSDWVNAVENDSCCFCEKRFDEASVIVRHHTHLPNENDEYLFVGLAHSDCNLKARVAKKFPCFMHNFGSYDLHFIIKSLSALRANGIVKSAEAIPKTTEKFLSLTLNGDIVFLDSLQFTMSSLDKLVKTMDTDDPSNFPTVQYMFQQYINKGADIKLLFKKGNYPYELMQSVKDFELDRLPDASAFYSNLTEKDIDPKQYEHAKDVWKSFNVKNMGEYHDIYVTLDVALLADVIQNTRSLMKQSYGLDLAHYYSLPGLAWDSCMKMSKVKLDYIRDPTMHCFIEQSIRGGYVSVGSLRCAKANNVFMGPEYNPDEETSFLLYIDANNLYGYAMSCPLPTRNFEWITQETHSSHWAYMSEHPNQYVKSLSDRADFGFTMEVDLEIPKELHYKFNDFPPAVVKRCVDESETSESYQRPMMQGLGINPSVFKCAKLIGDLYDKKNYIVHSRALKTYVEIGCKITKIHKVLRFEQAPWMEKFISFNTEKRKIAKNDFEKNFWKLLSNSCFGKCIESVRDRRNVRIIGSEEDAFTYTKKPTLHSIIPIDDDTHLFLMKRKSVLLNKPILVGTSILDISKSVMHDMHYKFMQKKYGERAKLIYTDTDSLIYHIKTENIFQDMKENMEHFDMSEYPIDHPLFGEFYDPKHKKQLGFFKDETAGSIISHVSAPRPKLYCLRRLTIDSVERDDKTKEYLKNEDGTWKYKVIETKKGKGLSATAVENRVTMADYTRVLEMPTILEEMPANPEKPIQTYATMVGIRSYRHVIHTEIMKKKAINGYDSKRFQMDCVNSLSYGHRDIPLYE